MRGIIFEKQDDFAQIGTMQRLVIESIKRIVMTAPRERPNNPNFGFGARNYLFTPIFDNISDFNNTLKQTIEQYEIRVLITDVQTIKTGTNSFKVSIKYVLKQFYQDEQNLDIDVGL